LERQGQLPHILKVTEMLMDEMGEIQEHYPDKNNNTCSHIKWPGAVANHLPWAYIF
jgi:hypothetical protein